MSTKAIREALGALADSEPGASDGSEQARLVAAALREVEGIERAAAVLQDVRVSAEHPSRDALNSACFLMETIAKNAPLATVAAEEIAVTTKPTDTGKDYGGGWLK